MPHRFTWTCRSERGTFDLFSPGVTQIEYQIEGQSANALGAPETLAGHVDRDTLILRDPGTPVWVRFHRGSEQTKWVLLKSGFGETFDTSSSNRFTLGV